MKTMPWYRVPEVWLLIFLVAGGVGGGVTLAAIAMSLPDASIANAATQKPPH
ncbi:MAG TPA: hypothetical protein VI258_08155 [Rhodanobacteraceae bacterium]